ncbi:glycosyltransferase family 2 protein [Bdellovibrio svalbardensis]|uniref:Glycosyltransferase family 2 protein n=1 Tax=Bdellovibrio svalbardensis TaxID=2972972 RepID=A0ABT6DL09_9BACT|nr:glycosyltransferase family 2 protein [Bdellovibrio svalbardensis]MDG0817341.1 glycosyltransferase family 2 protein [Bdellovibrio svalbardensis]
MPREPQSSEVLLSIISPVYMAEKLVAPLVEAIDVEMARWECTYEIILVEDGSPDKSWEAILEVSTGNPRVKGLKLSRNFGQHKAITAGLKEGRGEWFVVMDCDLQDRPEEIEGLYRKALEGFDIVLGQRVERQDGFFKKLFSKCFYKTLSWLTGTEFDATIANFGIYGKKVIKAINGMNEPIRFFPVMVKWCGFKAVSIPVSHDSRLEGKSSYSIMKLCNLGLDIVLAYSDKPLRMVAALGVTMSLISIFMTILVVERALTHGFQVLGYASLVCLVLFCTGLIVFILGVVGLYIGKIFESTKQRPIYLVDERINFE